jgi:hypothetical protein
MPVGATLRPVAGRRLVPGFDLLPGIGHIKNQTTDF